MKISDYLVLLTLITPIFALWVNLQFSKRQIFLNDRSIIDNHWKTLYEHLTKAIPYVAKQQLEKLDEIERIEYEIYLKLKDAFIERLLTTYEIACGSYLDGKVDKKRFKKVFNNEISDLFTSENTKSFLKVDDTKYNAIKKVYKNWFILEE